MKAYIQDLCGDENPIDIDVAILQCMLQDAIFEKFVGALMNKSTMQEITDVIYEVIDPYLPKLPIWYDALYEDLKGNVKEIK